MTITEFLEARIAEDEAVLERRGAFPHSTHGMDEVGAYNPRCPDCLGLPGKARVLAECKAKRALVEVAHTAECYGDHVWILRALAAVYADHPEYDPAWSLTDG